MQRSVRPPADAVLRPLATDDGGGWWYLAEDYAFCHRAAQAGIPITADTTIRLGHVGPYAYGWEDAGRDRVTHDTFVYHLALDGSEGGRPPS